MNEGDSKPIEMQGMRKNELGILFRNNHFNVIFCHNEAVWVLATDQGYLFEVRPPDDVAAS